MMTLSGHLRSNTRLAREFLWLCRQRRRWPETAGVWSFRRAPPRSSASRGGGPGRVCWFWNLLGFNDW